MQTCQNGKTVVMQNRLLSANQPSLSSDPQPVTSASKLCVCVCVSFFTMLAVFGLLNIQSNSLNLNSDERKNAFTFLLKLLIIVGNVLVVQDCFSRGKILSSNWRILITLNFYAEPQCRWCSMSVLIYW